MNCSRLLSAQPTLSAACCTTCESQDVHHHPDSSLVYPPYVQLHHSFPAILGSTLLIAFDTRLCAVHGGVPDSGLELGFHEVLVSWKLILVGWMEGVMILMKRLLGEGCPPGHQLSTVVGEDGGVN